MKKRDFIQQTSAQFLPALAWDLDKAIRYAEQLWQRLDQRGYGDAKPQGPRDIAKAYDKLSPLQKAAFDLFWSAFDYKHGRDRAAGAWLKLGELKKSDHDRIVAAAKREAEQRKKLPDGQSPIMAEGWLSQRRWLDGDETENEQMQKRQNAHAAQVREITAELNHAKNMADIIGDDYWHNQVTRLTEQLKQLRPPHD